MINGSFLDHHPRTPPPPHCLVFGSKMIRITYPINPPTACRTVSVDTSVLSADTSWVSGDTSMVYADLSVVSANTSLVCRDTCFYQNRNPFPQN